MPRKIVVLFTIVAVLLGTMAVLPAVGSDNVSVAIRVEGSTRICLIAKSMSCPAERQRAPWTPWNRP